MKKILKLSILFVLFLAALNGCGDNAKENHSSTDVKKPFSWGKFSNVYMFADKQEWDYSQLEIKRSLERTFYTTTNEKLFSVLHVPIEEIKSHYKFTYLLFLCDLHSSNPVSNYVKSILPDNILQCDDEQPAKIYSIRDLWAQNQTVVFVLGTNIEILLNYTFANSEELFRLFEQKERNRLQNLIYKRGMNTREVDYQKRNYPWSLDLPKGYVVFRRNDSQRTVSYLLRVKKYADRYLAIYYEDMETNMVNKQWLWEQRQRLGRQYYENDTFAIEDVRQERVTFLEYSGFRLSGRWQNKDYFIGGTFSAYAFYDEKTKKAFFIDSSVYFPQGDKLRPLIELDIIAHTFKSLRNNADLSHN